MLDLIFLDCAMPGKSGFDVATTIRTMEAEGYRELTPLIAVTAHVSPSVRNRCLMAGMDDYLAKPFSREEIAVVLKRYMTSTTGVQPIASTGRRDFLMRLSADIRAAFRPGFGLFYPLQQIVYAKVASESHVLVNRGHYKDHFPLLSSKHVSLIIRKGK